MIASVLANVAGVLPFAGLPLVSSVWFPADQRATATAILSLCNYAGVTFSFILGNDNNFIILLLLIHNEQTANRHTNLQLTDLGYPKEQNYMSFARVAHWSTKLSEQQLR